MRNLLEKLRRRKPDTASAEMLAVLSDDDVQSDGVRVDDEDAASEHHAHQVKAQGSERRKPDSVVSPPLNAIVGWIPGVSAKDAESYAKGFIERRFDAQDSSYYAVAEFLEGYFYEVHEGGSGVSHLPEIVARLTRDPDTPVWFPSGRRVFQVNAKDGDPYGMLLPEDLSREMRQSGIPPVEATGSMRPAVNNGFHAFIGGLAFFATGLTFLAAAAGFYVATSASMTVSRPTEFEKLPHRQWALVSKSHPTNVVASLTYKEGSWEVRWRNHQPNPPPQMAQPSLDQSPITAKDEASK